MRAGKVLHKSHPFLGFVLVASPRHWGLGPELEITRHNNEWMGIYFALRFLFLTLVIEYER